MRNILVAVLICLAILALIVFLIPHIHISG